MSKKLMMSLLALPLVVGLSGCANSPEHYETNPVEVQTSKGIVTCQLYTTRMVLWDRSINRPGNMSVTEADEYCRRAGYEVQGRTAS